MPARRNFPIIAELRPSEESAGWLSIGRPSRTMLSAMSATAIRRCCLRASPAAIAGPSRSLSVSSPVLKKGKPRGQAKEAKRAQRSDAKSSAHDIRPSPAPRHPWEGQDDLGATETAEAGLRTEVVSTKGKKSFTSSEVGDDQVQGGQFDIKDVKDGMAKAVDRLRREMNGIVGRVGRLTPALLDAVRVDAGEGSPKPLTSYANVTVRDSEHLTVSCYDASVRSRRTVLSEVGLIASRAVCEGGRARAVQ